MSTGAQIRRYELYGDTVGGLAPEFVHIESIADRSSRHDWTIAPHSHPEIFQILLVDEGAVEITIDGAALAHDGAVLITVPSACTHAFRFAADTQGWVLSIASALLGDARLAGLCGELEIVTGPATVTAMVESDERLQRLRWLLTDFAERQAGDREGPAVSTLALVGLLVALAQEAIDAGQAPQVALRGRSALAQNFRKTVDAAFREHRPVAEHAERLGTTVPTLTRVCRDTFDKTPARMLSDRLLLEAMRSLTYTSANVAEVAVELGFSDPAYFARWFKVNAGMTASRFRSEKAWFWSD